MNYQKYKRVFGIVLDSVGTGAAADAAKYGDVGADTLGHVGAAYHGRLALPNLGRLGIGNLRDQPLLGVTPAESPLGYCGRMAEISAGKDSMDGHWEMMGLPVKQSLATFPEGFPAEIIQKLEEFSGRRVIVNHPYSGTAVIHDYGERQLDTGELIVYASGDSVMQIAAHEDVIPLTELYRICVYARTLLNGPDIVVGRVIARPYIGPDKDHFTRTASRRDFSLEPTGETAIDRLHQASWDTIAIGKINDIFSGRGFAQTYHNESNLDGMAHLDEVMGQDFSGFCFANLVDFDTMYGHWRDPIGFGRALMDFDQRLGTVLDRLHDDDLLVITADHGNDPGFTGTDHTREMVPLLVYSPSMHGHGTLGTRSTFADFGATVLENFNLPTGQYGSSFLRELQ